MIDGSPTKKEAIEYIRKYNPNDLSFESDWFALIWAFGLGLDGLAMNFIGLVFHSFGFELTGTVWIDSDWFGLV